jgi:hypothetical protein
MIKEEQKSTNTVKLEKCEIYIKRFHHDVFEFFYGLLMIFRTFCISLLWFFFIIIFIFFLTTIVWGEQIVLWTGDYGAEVNGN